jgi:hypothetical protein
LDAPTFSSERPGLWFAWAFSFSRQLCAMDKPALPSGVSCTVLHGGVQATLQVRLTARGVHSHRAISLAPSYDITVAGSLAYAFD